MIPTSCKEGKILRLVNGLQKGNEPDYFPLFLSEKGRGMFKNFYMFNFYFFKGRVAVSPAYTFHNSSVSLKGLKENECLHEQNVMFLGK